MPRRLIRKVLPDGSKQRMMAGRIKSYLLHGKKTPAKQYRIWIKTVEPNTVSPVLTKQNLKISILVPCYNTPYRYIDELIQSVRAQTYKNWQLCIADGSTDEAASQAIAELCNQDDRIIYTKAGENLGISGNTNQAIKVATGDFVAFLDHDDILAPNALNEVALKISNCPGVNIVYSDEDRLSENGKVRQDPLFKPDWSLDFFLSVNYVTHFFVIERKLLTKLGGLRKEYDGSQDYDLMLRALDYQPRIEHVAKVLYHMRKASTSTAHSMSTKSYAHNAGNAALKEYFVRNNIKAKVLEVKDQPTNHRIRYEIAGDPLVSIIIPFKDKADLLKNCVTSIINKTKYSNYEIILVSNNSVEKKTTNYLKSLKNNSKIRQFVYDHPFNYSAVNNYGRQKAKGQVLVFLNNDTKVINPEWLEELTSVALQKGVGAVGAMLLYPDKTIQHAGIVLGLTGMAGHVFRDLHPNTHTPLWLPNWPRNFIAVTGACLAVEATKFDQVHGFNEDFIVCGSDVTLGIDLYQAGYRNTYWPFAKLVHYESKSVGSYKNIPPSDYDNSLITYRPYLGGKDPYFNVNLNLMSEIPTLRTNNDKEPNQ